MLVLSTPIFLSSRYVFGDCFHVAFPLLHWAVAMQVSFKSPTAAALPQDELSQMSHGQLLQCANVLHAGWTSANLKASNLQQELDQTSKRLKAKVASLEEGEAIAERQISSLQRECVELKAREKEMQIELINLRRVVKIADEAQESKGTKETSPQVEHLKQQLLFAQADIVKLERSLRSITPIETQILQDRIRMMNEQRESDKRSFQEKDIELQLLRMKLNNAQEEITQLQQIVIEAPKARKKSGVLKNAYSSQHTETPVVHSSLASGTPPAFYGPSPLGQSTTAPHQSSSFATQATGDDHDSRPSNSPGSQSMAPHGFSSSPYGTMTYNPYTQSMASPHDSDLDKPPVEIAEKNTQTEAFMIKALELLEKANEENEELQRQNAELAAAYDTQHLELERLRRDVSKTQESLSKKDDLINQLAKSGPPALSRTSSTVTQSDLAGSRGAAERDTNKEHKDQVQRTKLRNDELEKELHKITSEKAKVAKDLAQMSKSLSMIAEENAKLTHQIQTVTSVTPSQLEELLAGKEEIITLRTKVQAAEAERHAHQTGQGELQKAHKEVATLNARVSKYQHEIGQLTMKKDKLTKEVNDVQGLCEAQRKQIAKLQDELRTVVEARGGVISPQKRRPASRQGPELLASKAYDIFLAGFRITMNAISEKQHLFTSSNAIVVEHLALSAEQWQARVRALEEDDQRAGNVAGLLRADKESLSDALTATESRLEQERSLANVRATEIANITEKLKHLETRLQAEDEIHQTLRERSGEVENKYNALKLNHERLQTKHRELSAQYRSLADSVREPSFVAAPEGYGSHREKLEEAMKDREKHEDVASEVPVLHSTASWKSARSNESFTHARSDSNPPVSRERTSTLSPHQSGTQNFTSPGKVRHGSLGMTLASEDADGSPINTTHGTVWVEAVVRNGPAQLSGVKCGDIIVSVGDVEVHSLDDVARQLDMCAANGSTFVVCVRPKGSPPNTREDVGILL